MYGLLLENLSEWVKSVYGEEKWEEIRRLAKVNNPSFSTHQVYSETLLPKLAKKACVALDMSESDMFMEMGKYFISFVGQYGYDQMLSVLGRHLRDFFNGLDNLHEYLKFSYPRMRPPSFFCEGESKRGLMLHYRSKRKGYAYYTMGQIREVFSEEGACVSPKYFNKEKFVLLIGFSVMYRTDFSKRSNHAGVRKLADSMDPTVEQEFDNIAYEIQQEIQLNQQELFSLQLKGNILLDVFPFCILFDSHMKVKSIGNSLMQILPGIVGKKLTDWFDLSRPLIEFKFQNILRRTNNIFEIYSNDNAQLQNSKAGERKLSAISVSSNDGDEPKFVLKGQMMFMEDWKLILFLSTPVMPDLDTMIYSGLYINDLSMHDFSRDLMLAGTQQSVELRLALDQEQLKSKKLEESMKMLDEEMKRTDELLYQMIPKAVADRLRKGVNPINTCETFESVTILFSDVVTFTEICGRLTPMEVVSLLNAMYSIFDSLTEKHNVYKVETIGDAYMVVAGAPERREKHAEMICNMGLDMVEAITDLKDPSTGTEIKIRVGLHTGTVVAGVVGMKMPRYCLFGDAVNTASRMESTSEALKIHISEPTATIISSDYATEERGEVTIKGKGVMKTYWLLTRKGRVSIKGEFQKYDLIQEDVRRNSMISHGYSPVTFQEVERQSRMPTPMPRLQPVQDDNEMVETLKIEQKEEKTLEPPNILVIENNFVEDSTDLNEVSQTFEKNEIHENPQINIQNEKDENLELKMQNQKVENVGEQNIGNHTVNVFNPNSQSPEVGIHNVTVFKPNSQSPEVGAQKTESVTSNQGSNDNYMSSLPPYYNDQSQPTYGPPTLKEAISTNQYSYSNSANQIDPMAPRAPMPLANYALGLNYNGVPPPISYTNVNPMGQGFFPGEDVFNNTFENFAGKFIYGEQLPIPTTYSAQQRAVVNQNQYRHRIVHSHTCDII